MAIEDFDAWSEDVDSDNDISNTSTRVTWSTMEKEAQSWFADDKDPGHFSGDFEHEFESAQTASDHQGSAVMYSMANQLDAWDDIDSESDSELGAFYYDLSGTPRIYCVEVFEGAWNQGDKQVDVTEGQLYYFTFKRDEAVGDFGTLYLYIYDAPAKEGGDLVDTITVTLVSKEDFRYLFACQSRGGTGDDNSGYTQNVELNEAGSAAVTGTVVAGGVLESEIVTGGETIIITLTDDTWIAAGTGPIGTDANTQALIDGIDGDVAGGTGWDEKVKALLVPDDDVVRDSNTQCTITLVAAADYAISSNETITVTIPAEVLTGGVEIVADATFAITNEAGGTGIPVLDWNRRQQMMRRRR